MDKENIRSVPYVAFEAAQARSERYIKRLIIALIFSILVGFCSNLAWLYVWNQYDYESETTTETRTYTQDGKGLNIIGNLSEVELSYGAKSNDNNNDKAKKTN